MAYEKTVWTKGEVVTAEKLNKIEDGIDAASKKIGNTVMSTAGNQLNDNALTSENLASVGFVETRIRDLVSALNPLGRSTETGDDDKKEDMARKILQEVKFVDGRAFRAEYTPIPLATKKKTGLMQVGANLDVTEGVVKVSDTIDSTEDNLVLNDNVTIGNKIANTTSYKNVTIKGLLMANGGISTSQISNSTLTIGTVPTNQNETINRQTLTVEANATFNGTSTFNDITVNGTVNGTLKASNMVTKNINSSDGNNLILNGNVTIRKNTTDSDNHITSYGNVTVAGSLTTAGASIKGAFKVGAMETNNTISNFYGPVYITGQLTGKDLSVTKISATRIQINKVADSDISYNNYTTAINGTVGITSHLTAKGNVTFGTENANNTATLYADTTINGSVGITDNVTAMSDVTIDGQLNCNSDIVIQVNSPGISWAAGSQTNINYRSLIKADGTIYSLFAEYNGSDPSKYNTILEYKPNITGSAFNGILNIGTAMPTTGNIDTTDSTMVNTINIAATNEICLKAINASIVLDSNTEINGSTEVNGNTKVNGILEIINDTNNPVLYIGRANETKVGFTHENIANIANLASLPSLPTTSGDYILHYDGSQYTWVQQTT